LKLPLLLSQFLYQTRKLDLPGIGSFVLDPSAVIPEASDRNQQTPASGITFKNTTVINPDDALIQFIKEHTGKMKPLAAADLDFFLTTGKQLLNIGKPFYLEGIGTLINNREGRLDFTPGEYSTARLDDPEKDRKKNSSFDEVPREYEPKSNPNSNNVRQMLLLVGLIGGLIAIGWGGYYLYKRNTFVEPSTENQATIIKDTPAEKKQDTISGQAGAQPSTTPGSVAPAKDASSTKPSDSPGQVASVMPTVATGENLYKFIILETVKKGRALRRYNQLLGFQLNIKMEQKDSSYFKLYFPIAAAPRDTAHIRDSLMDVYAAQVRIER
jgi:hypothetical protein